MTRGQLFQAVIEPAEIDRPKNHPVVTAAGSYTAFVQYVHKHFELNTIIWYKYIL